MTLKEKTSIPGSTYMVIWNQSILIWTRVFRPQTLSYLTTKFFNVARLFKLQDENNLTKKENKGM